jgi:hypothetical protein
VCILYLVKKVHQLILAIEDALICCLVVAGDVFAAFSHKGVFGLYRRDKFAHLGQVPRVKLYGPKFGGKLRESTLKLFNARMYMVIACSLCASII